MAKNFSELEAKMSPESLARSEELARILLAEMEKPFSVSTLRAQVEAMGGKVEVITRWPDGSFDKCDLAELMETPNALPQGV